LRQQAAVGNLSLVMFTQDIFDTSIDTDSELKFIGLAKNRQTIPTC